MDTNVVPATAPARAGRAEALVAWLEERSDELYLSAVTVTEIESGIARLRREGGARRTKDLSAWLEALLHLYGHRVLAFDLAAARIAGAASAHDLTLLTRNTRHFAPLDVAMVDPFGTLPP